MDFRAGRDFVTFVAPLLKVVKETSLDPKTEENAFVITMSRGTGQH